MKPNVRNGWKADIRTFQSAPFIPMQHGVKSTRLIFCMVALCALPACDPLGSSNERTVPQNEVGSIDLLVPGRKLPRSADNVRVFTKHFQDTVQYVRFDADADEANSFAEQLIAKPLSRDGYVNLHGPDVDWWISDATIAQAERGEDATIDGDGMPAVAVALLRKGPKATVWLKTYTAP